MNRIIKGVFRRFYRTFVRAPGIRHAIAREMAGMPGAANTVANFVDGEFGMAYGLTKRDRAQLVEAFDRNNRCIESATSSQLHTILAMGLLSIPRDVSGDVIECGAFKGASTASISLLCRMVGRRFLVCDSFEGLPDEGEIMHVAPHFGHYGYYKKGMFCGRLEEVRDNVEKYGDISVCEFVPGFFSESLKTLSRPIAFGFLDVDLVGSMKDCLRYIWPLLVEGGTLYSDDAGDLDVVRVCFDDHWWKEVLHEPAPGFIGSGCGLPLGPKGCSLGYIRKSAQTDHGQGRKVPWLWYPETEDVSGGA